VIYNSEVIRSQCLPPMQDTAIEVLQAKVLQSPTAIFTFVGEHNAHLKRGSNIKAKLPWHTAPSNHCTD